MAQQSSATWPQNSSHVPPPPTPLPRALQLALFAAGAVWLLAARALAAQASQGIATRFNLPMLQPLLDAVFLLFLLLLGFKLVDWMGSHAGDFRQINALPRRTTSGREWALGAALGWGALLVAVLPMMLGGDLHPHFAFAPSAWGFGALALLVLLVWTLAIEVGFRGYLLARLAEATGPGRASLLLSLLYAVVMAGRPNATALSVLVTFVAGLLYSLAYFRTHALWLGWGLHFAWAASTAVFFGLPNSGFANFSSIVITDVSGRDWLTGGAYGPDGALLTVLVLLLTMAVLYHATRDLAWAYTHPVIIPGGYAMDVLPPAAHVEMEQAVKPPTLVQILPANPTDVRAGTTAVSEPIPGSDEL